VPAPKKGAAAKPSPQTSPFPLKVPSFRRSAPGNTSRLVSALQELTDLGVPRDEALRLGMTPFPVAGPARYTHDWLNPRYTPTPHLHHGIDIFAAFGTPVVASGGGRIATFGRSGAGGLSVWVEADDGTALYYAHLLAVHKGMQRGQRVERGTIIGYVGDSGNAEGGPPHLHFQWHPPVRNRKGQVTASGVSVSNHYGLNRAPAVDPKPLIDAWLREAEENVPGVIAEQKQGLAGGGGPGTAAIPTVRPRQLLLLSPLDPTVGVLGLVREAIEATGVGGLLGGFEGTDPEVQSLARLAVDAPYVRLAEMTGDLAGDRPRSMLAVPPSQV
jgi:hypothetical protein